MRPAIEQFARANSNQIIVVGVAGAADPDQVRDFLVEHSITFTTLVDRDLAVTAHYGIGYWSAFWLLDPYGNRIGNQPHLFTTHTAHQLLAQQQPQPDLALRAWDLPHLSTQAQATTEPAPLPSDRSG